MKQFYERALPQHGVYCVSAIDGTGHIRNKFAEDLDGLFEAVEEFKAKKKNVFIAPGTFKDYSRKASNSHSLKSFFIDLDVGSRKAYPTKDDALAALDEFVRKFELPPPVRVDSGNGIHAYWIFDEEIPYLEWKPYAERFKEFCLENELHIDPVVTADAARIMRCVDSLNYKSTPPNPVWQIDLDIEEYSFDMFKEFLGEVEPDVTHILGAAPKGLDEDTKKLLKYDNFESVFRTIAQRSVDDEGGCNQIRFILEHADRLTEPMWYAGLSIARHCVDWEEVIHEMSEPYPGYSREETIKKANQSLGKPQGCEIFEQHNPGGCKNCPYRGKITNPLALGKQLKEAPPVPVEDTSSKKEDPLIPAFPAFLKPYSRGANGGIYFTPPPSTSKDGKLEWEDPVLLSAHDFFPFKRMFSPTDGECLMMRVLLPNDPPREFMLPMKSVYTPDEFKKLLTGNGVLFNPTATNQLMGYVIKWAQYLVSADAAEQMRMQMGWTEANDAFVIGKTEVTKDGIVRKAAASPLVHSVSKLLVTKGSYASWKAAAACLNEPGFESHAFTLLCGFGSPLMRYTTTNGVVVCLTGGSGNGKTGALFAGMSIMGNPYELALTGNRQSTDNGLVGWYLNLRNILFGLDEASNKRPEEVSELVHRIAQGKSKIRMQASVNAVRELELSASLIAVFTSNQSLYDKLTSLKKSPDGEVARLVEFQVEKPQILVDNPERGKEIFNQFREHYGHAGPEYIKHLFKVGDAYIKKLIDKWEARFRRDFGADASYRFYENLIAAAFAGGELANEMGAIQYDLDRIYYAVLLKMASIRDDTVKLNNIDYKALIGEFINRHHTGFLILHDDRVVSEPRSPLVGRIEVHNQTQYISKTEFRKYLSEIQVSMREFEVAMLREGILQNGGKKQRLATGWKSGMNYPAVMSYAFRTEIPEDLLNG